MHYHDQTCISCQKSFAPEDDIVVCPDCGTPYHRDCWKENGACINKSLHESNKSWYETHPPKEEAPAPEAVQEASPQTGYPAQSSEAPFAEGIEFHGRKIYPDEPMLGLNPDEEIDGVTVGELSTYVGKNLIYYLPIFLTMKESGKKTSFNLIGLISPSIYFASRKLWGAALLCVFIQCLLRLPGILFSLTELVQFEYLIDLLHLDTVLFNILLQVTSVGDIAFSIVAGVFANYIYYSSAKKKIRQVRELYKNRPLWERLSILREKGGISGAGIVGICSIWFLISLAFSTVTMLWL